MSSSNVVKRGQSILGYHLHVDCVENCMGRMLVGHMNAYIYIVWYG